jgi:hypothetical protein
MPRGDRSASARMGPRCPPAASWGRYSGGLRTGRGRPCAGARARCAAGHQAARPQPTRRVLARPRLLERLTQGTALKLTLVCASPPCSAGPAPARGGRADGGQRAGRRARGGRPVPDDDHLVEAPALRPAHPHRGLGGRPPAGRPVPPGTRRPCRLRADLHRQPPRHPRLPDRGGPGPPARGAGAVPARDLGAGAALGAAVRRRLRIPPWFPPWSDAPAGAVP